LNSLSPGRVRRLRLAGGIENEAVLKSLLALNLERGAGKVEARPPTHRGPRHRRSRTVRGA
jgi:hypothetical protein